jgi:hypothetical protein
MHELRGWIEQAASADELGMLTPSGKKMLQPFLEPASREDRIQALGVLSNRALKLLKEAYVRESGHETQTT